MIETSYSETNTNITEYKFCEIFDLNEIQKLQDSFSAATGVASIITKPDGTPITKPSSFCSLCNEIRKTEKGLKNCFISDSTIGSPKKDGPQILKCLSGGLLDGGASIIVDGNHIANWLIGQVLDEDYKIEDLLPYADVIGVNRDVYRNELIRVKRMSKEQFKKVCDFLYLSANQLSKYAIKNTSLEAKIKEKEEEEHLKDEFFSNLSHEFRTPLNILVNCLQMVQLQNDKIDFEMQHKIDRYLKIMKQNCNRLTRLINNLIDITKINTNFYETKKFNCNLIDVIEKITLSSNVYIENKGLKLDFYKDIEQKIVYCDPDIFERIILNLISNAIKFSKKNGTISVYIYGKEDYITIHVKDNGIGIPKDKLNDIFKRFKQVDNVFTRSCEGSGIGLSLVKAFVEMHDGTISVSSEYGKGCEFIITIPVKVNTEILNKNEKELIIEKNNIERINIEFSDIYF